MIRLVQCSPCGGEVDAPLAGGVVPFGSTVDVPAEDAALLVASGHFREATEADDVKES